MRKPPRRAATSNADDDGVGYKAYTPKAAAVQVSRPSTIRTLSDASARITIYRYDLNVWLAGPPGQAMPLPGEYGLALAPCSSAAILWPGGGS